MCEHQCECVCVYVHKHMPFVIMNSCGYRCPRNHIHVLHVCEHVQVFVCACVYVWASPYMYGCLHVCVCMCTCVAVGGTSGDSL